MDTFRALRTGSGELFRRIGALDQASGFSSGGRGQRFQPADEIARLDRRPVWTKPLAAAIALGCFLAVASAAERLPDPAYGSQFDLAHSGDSWKGGDRPGWKAGQWEAGIAIGSGLGTRVLFSREHHDWVLSVIHLGWVFSDEMAPGHWYRGNWELLGQIFAGGQYRADTSYVVGGGPVLRYNFDTDTRWVPYAFLGGGAAWTDIRNGDLSTDFEFNLTGGIGLHWFVNRHVALTGEYRYLHMSNAGLKSPNLGVDTENLFFGVSWFF